MKKYKPKKKEKVIPKREVITEPVRRSIFDVVQTNLKLAKRIDYLHRILYIGEHKYLQDEIEEAKESIYKLTNNVYNTEPLSGILLYYTNFFCCIIEGSERALARYITLLFEKENERLKNVKLLKIIHHIKGRFNEDWLSYYARPPERVDEIDENSNLEDSMRYVTDCCEKIYNFANAFVADNVKKVQEEKEEGELSDEFGTLRSRVLSLAARDPYARFLPELKLLNFLCKCKYLENLQAIDNYYQRIGKTKDFSSKAWPAPKNFVRYDIFDEPYDPITDLPQTKEHAKQDEEEDQEVVSIPDANPT